MPRKQKKFHFIYKTTNRLNEKFYVGMHSTNNLEDGYLGGGKRLWYSIQKYGLENHECEILEFLPSREDLKRREAEIINEELLANPLCMNLKFGGEGGCCPATIRTPSVQRVVAAGTIAAGARAVSIANVGDQTGTVLGTNLKGGEVISFSAGSDQDTLSAIAYNPGTSEFLITTIV